MIARLLDVFATLVLPAYAIVALGWGLARAPRIPPALLTTFRRLVFDLILPLYLFRTLASVQLPERFPITYVLGYYGATLALYAIVTALTWRRSGPGTANIQGLGGVYANAVLLGTPVITAALGDAAALPLFALIGLHAPLLAFATGALAEIARPDTEASLTPLLRNILLGLLRNPIILSIAGGLAWNLIQGPLPEDWQSATATASKLIPPLALVAMGIGLADYGLRSAIAPAMGVCATKLFVHPLIVAVVLALLPGIPHLWWQTAVLMAALPTGVNVYLFAAQQRAGEAVAAATVAIATPASMLTLTAVLALTIR